MAAPPEAGPATLEIGAAESLRSILSRGVDQAIISQEQAAKLAALATGPAGPTDDEHLRFITGFADIFVTIGILLFIGSAGGLTLAAFGDAAAYAVAAALAWLLAEFFTRRRRMALPSIVLLVLFAAASFAAVGYAAIGALSSGEPTTRESASLLIAASATLILCAVHYWRFRVPITVAAGMAALVAAGVALGFLKANGFTSAHLDLILFASGLVVFALAMRFDLSDPARVTRRSDIAFWLHLLAAPLIVHPVLSAYFRPESLGPAGDGTGEILTAAHPDLTVLGIVLLLTVVALVIDRRAILVSGLAYAGYTLRDLIQHFGGQSSSLVLSLMALGAFVLLLSAGWRPLRHGLLRLLPEALSRRLPHPVGP